MSTVSRPEGKPVNLYDSRPNLATYLSANVTLGVFSAWALRQTNLDQYSVQPLTDKVSAYWSAFKAILPNFPFAKAEELGTAGSQTQNIVKHVVQGAAPEQVIQNVVKTAAPEAPKIVVEQAAQETAKVASRWFSPITNAANSVKDFGLSTWTSVSSYAHANRDWIGLAAGFAATFSAVNYLAADRIKNSYKRNAFAFIIAGSAVHLASNYGLGHALSATQVIDAGLQFLACKFALKLVAPLAQRVIDTAFTAARWDIAYPSKVFEKVSSKKRD